MTEAATPDDPGTAEHPAVEPVQLPLLELRDALPDITNTAAGLAEVVQRVRAGTGPVALDAERASGYKYSGRAYLIQLRREGSGAALIDPIAFHDLSDLDSAIGDAEWILHAATQDLACLGEVGMHPRALFDTELAGRLLNLPRVGLASLVENLLDRHLAKEHSAADWSTRPLPAPWLVYAALDVEVLIELRDEMERQLIEAGKLHWAHQEFEALLSFSGPAVRQEPWRRTSGIHKVRGRRALAVVRASWQARDAIAADRDVTPGRIISDSSILEIAQAQPADMAALKLLRAMRGRGPRRYINQWHEAVQSALALDEAELPTSSQRFVGPPPPRSWADKNPDAAARLGAAREAMGAIAEAHNVPVENLLNPQVLRRLAWEPPPAITGPSVRQALVDDGARQWQIDLTVEQLVAPLQANAAPAS